MIGDLMTSTPGWQATMPEGDTVYRLAKRLGFMVGNEVTHTSLRVPRYATVDFDRARCERVWPYGKHLFMQFDELVLHTHLKMEGYWRYYPVGSQSDPGHSARVVLRLAKPELNPATRREVEVAGHWLGVVEVFPAADFQAEMGYLGPDILDPDFDAAEARRRIEAQPDREIGRAILDQHNVAGLGNVYRVETCFLAGVHPAALVKDVDVEKLLRIARRLIWENRDSELRVTTGVKIPGQNLFIYGRNHQPCRRCGAEIHSSTLGGDDDLERIIWWCPRCQAQPK